MIGEYEIFPFHSANAAIRILKDNLPIDSFSQRYILWTLQEHDELRKRFLELNSRQDVIIKLLEKQPGITILDNGQYSITIASQSQGQRIVEDIMQILFPDEPVSDVPSKNGKEASNGY